MTEYEKLKAIIDEIDDLINHHVRSSAPAFKTWHTKAERFLIKKYGEESSEHKKFRNTYFAPMIWTGADEEQKFIKSCCDGLKACKAVFEVYLEELIEEIETIPQSNVITKPQNMDKIFIVHGHNGELKQSVARIIEKQGIEAIILSEQANQGRTIIEKFESYSDVGGQFVCLLLMT